MDIAALVANWKREETEPFGGWDFSHLSERMVIDKKPWSYMETARALLPQATALLDLGTGGGEKLMSLQDVWPPEVVAIEGYHPNFLLAKERLEPLGVQVIEAESGATRPLPFPHESFDLVISRHTDYNVVEVERVLKPGGRFLTKQVDGRSDYDLLAVFGAEPKWPFVNLANDVKRLADETDLVVEHTEEWVGQLTFTDVGAIVYYLKAIPWLVDNFSIDTHLEQLLTLQARWERGDPLSFYTAYFMLQARNRLSTMVGKLQVYQDSICSANRR